MTNYRELYNLLISSSMRHFQESGITNSRHYSKVKINATYHIYVIELYFNSKFKHDGIKLVPIHGSKNVDDYFISFYTNINYIIDKKPDHIYMKKFKGICDKLEQLGYNPENIFQKHLIENL